MAMVKEWSVYMVLCADGTIYTGMSNNVILRIARHNSGRGAKYTASRRPVRLIYEEIGMTRSTAGRRERVIKSMSADSKRKLAGFGGHSSKGGEVCW